jgi:Zn-dependent protease
VLVFFAYANLMLLFFNLIPIPPLDGSRVVQRFLPDRARDVYHSLERYGFIILFGVLYLLPSVFQAYINVTVLPVFSFITGLR